MAKDVIREASKKVREAKVGVEQYVGQDIKFWADFAQNTHKLDDLMESILYLERKKGLNYENELHARWMVAKIISLSELCNAELNNKKKAKEIKEKSTATRQKMRELL